jgi:hypothetical protein
MRSEPPIAEVAGAADRTVEPAPGDCFQGPLDRVASLLVKPTPESLWEAARELQTACEELGGWQARLTRGSGPADGRQALEDGLAGFSRQLARVRQLIDHAGTLCEGSMNALGLQDTRYGADGRAIESQAPSLAGVRVEG